MFTAITGQHDVSGHPVTAATLARVRATLRAALNAAIPAGLISVNAASRAELPQARRPRPVVWTAARIAEWQRTGIRPPVAVWTPAQTVEFLNAIRGHRQYAAYYLIALRGLRRVQQSRSADPGEAVTLAVRAGDGLVWVEVLDGGPRAPELRWAGRDAEGGPRASACGGPGGTVGVADGLLPGLSCGAAKYPAPGVTTRYWRQAWVRDADRSVQTQLREVHARSMRGIEERASCQGSSQTPGCVRYGPSGGPQTR
jgi:hypothetical protein